MPFVFLLDVWAALLLQQRRDFPMHFKRLGFCDFWIVKGYMCKKDFAGPSRSSPATGGEQCERGQKCTIILHLFKPLGVSEISEDPSGELGVFKFLSF